MLGLDSPVTHNGQVTTIRALAERGLITFTAESHYGKADRPAYFADTGNGQGWEIAKRAYDAALKLPGIVISRPLALMAIRGESVRQPAPLTFAEQQEIITRRFKNTPLAWLLDVDYPNWETAYHWLMSAPLDAIRAFAPTIEGESWNGQTPEC